MKKILKQLPTLVLIAALSMAAGPAPALSQVLGKCMGNRVINQARASGAILPLPDILRLARLRPKEVLNVRVCDISGQPYYLINVLRNNGVAQNLVLRAIDGAPYIAG
ncbi:hypothetical protein MNBD_ALPHA12-1604 [hydrothermal vent metagenome]|uniref:PepSY domain-containing protein n=1 Tax=hydrothermal vent metagenome TaxID=652676 RepID=A0A3B0TV39_9ZZZZ